MGTIKKDNLKILIIRFGAIGDLIMISPAIRCLKLQLKSTIHIVCKLAYSPTVVHNPHIDKVYTLDSNWNHVMEQLKSERYDLIIDLHKTIRSYRMRMGLKAPVISIHKSTIQHRLHMMVRSVDVDPRHFVHEIFAGLEDLRLVDDGLGMEVFLDEASEQKIKLQLAEINVVRDYSVIALGGSHETKRVPAALAADYINSSQENIILLGGKDAINAGREVMVRINRYVHNGIGLYTLLESFAIIKNCQRIITGDTGMMHYAASADKDIVVVYGCTSPVFGMFPYFSDHSTATSDYLQAKELSCWPCSKAGRPTCPKKHMKCLRQWRAEDIISKINKEPVRNSNA